MQREMRQYSVHYYKQDGSIINCGVSADARLEPADAARIYWTRKQLKNEQYGYEVIPYEELARVDVE